MMRLPLQIQSEQPLPPGGSAGRSIDEQRKSVGCVRLPCWGFTLVELMMALGILSMFLFWAYQLFMGGTRTANKASWISSIVDQLRNGTKLISDRIKSSSYPTTLLADTVLDPSDNPNKTIANKYYLKILNNGDQIKAPTSGDLLIMQFVVCESEKPANSPPVQGQLTECKLWFIPKINSLAKVGDLRMDSETFKFSTVAPDYAKAGSVSLAPVSGSQKRFNICQDVEHVIFQVDPSATLPTDPTDLKFISVKIHCVFPKDPKTFKDSSIMITPNVGIDLLN